MVENKKQSENCLNKDNQNNVCENCDLKTGNLECDCKKADKWNYKPMSTKQIRKVRVILFIVLMAVAVILLYAKR